MFYVYFKGLAASGAAATAVRVPIGMTNKPTTLKPISKKFYF